MLSFSLHRRQGRDLRDVLLGRVFGAAALVRSGRQLGASQAATLVAGLLEAAKKKAFCKELAGEP